MEQTVVRCRICKKKLSNPKSIKREVGRICFRKWQAGFRGVQVSSEENVAVLQEKLTGAVK